LTISDAAPIVDNAHETRHMSTMPRGLGGETLTISFENYRAAPDICLTKEGLSTLKGPWFSVNRLPMHN
jgi:hypothetical protein